MNCQQIVDERLAERYVLHQLTQEEAERFEDHYMTCDACTDELERAEIMVRGFKRAAAEDLVATGALVAATGWRRRWLPIAAALALVALSLPLASRLLPARDKDDTQPTLVYLQPERSAEAAPSRQMRMSDKERRIVLVLELDPPFYSSYAATLQRHGSELQTFRDLELGGRDSLTLSIDSRFLKPGDHILDLDGLDADGRRVDAGRFSFRVLAAD